MFIKQISNGLENAPINETMKFHYRNELGKLVGRGLWEVQRNINNIFIRDTNARGVINKALVNLTPVVEKMSDLRKQITEKSGPQITGPRMEDIRVIPSGKTGRNPPKINARVLEFQKQWNQTVGGTPLKEDGLWGPKTKEAWDSVGGFAGLAFVQRSGPQTNEYEQGPQAVKIPADLNTVYSQLAEKFNQKFDALLSKSPNTRNYLIEQAKNIVNKYNKTPVYNNPEILGFWMDKIISKITKEDIAQAG